MPDFPSTSHDSRDRGHERSVMVEQQIGARGVHDERVLRAMSEVPREAFVPSELREFAYQDVPLPIAADQTISQPYIVALMLEGLALQGDEKVLEIGTGSGYAAAVLAHLAREVWTVERHPVLGLPDSYEQLLAGVPAPNFFLPLRSSTGIVRAGLLEPRLQRAIGVIYRPQTERASHYFSAVLPRQFDEFCWFAESRAIRPLDAIQLTDVPDTYPFGL